MKIIIDKFQLRINLEKIVNLFEFMIVFKFFYNYRKVSSHKIMYDKLQECDDHTYHT